EEGRSAGRRTGAGDDRGTRRQADRHEVSVGGLGHGVRAGGKTAERRGAAAGEGRARGRDRRGHGDAGTGQREGEGAVAAGGVLGHHYRSASVVEERRTARRRARAGDDRGTRRQTDRHEVSVGGLGHGICTGGETRERRGTTAGEGRAGGRDRGGHGDAAGTGEREAA